MSANNEIFKWDDHMWSTEKLCKEFKTNEAKGLTTAVAAETLGQDGENALTEKKAKPWYCIFLEEQTGFFSLLLWFGSFLCFIGYAIQEDKEDKANLYLGIVLGVVVFLTGVFSYMQTSKAASLMDDFKNFIPQTAEVCRDGQWGSLPSRQLVKGDLIKVKGGDNVPADLILLQVNEMKVNNASLTGESEDLLRYLENKHQNVFETGNVAFFGTQCTGGTGEGIVFRTGDRTVIGRIANLTIAAEAAETPLSIEIERFIKIISIVAISLGVGFFLFGLASYDVITNLVFMIGIIVANVPEGLLATVTVSLALTAKSMATKMVLVKNLESVETLGSTSCICSDKTGTLTQNRMTVSQIFYDRKIVDADVNYQIYKNTLAREQEKGADANLKNVAEPKYDHNDPGFKTLIQGVTLSTTSYFSYSPTDDELRAKIAKKEKKNIKLIPERKDVTEEAHPYFPVYKSYAQEMIDEEAKLSYVKRRVQGDASETGLVKFSQPLLEDAWAMGGINEFRQAHPCVKGPDGNEYQIPFSSDIKFNCIIRDMNVKVKEATNKEDNITVFIKGAPDKVIKRVSKMLVRGEEIPMDDQLMDDYDAANDRFASMGERVLGFARTQLEPTEFSKDYKFDVKKWKSW